MFEILNKNNINNRLRFGLELITFECLRKLLPHETNS